MITWLRCISSAAGVLRRRRRPGIGTESSISRRNRGSGGHRILGSPGNVAGLRPGTGQARGRHSLRQLDHGLESPLRHRRRHRNPRPRRTPRPDGRGRSPRSGALPHAFSLGPHHRVSFFRAGLSDAAITIYAAAEPGETERCLSGLMAGRNFPLELSETPSGKTYRRIGEEGLAVGGVRITICPLRHPQGCVAYKFEDSPRTPSIPRKGRMMSSSLSAGTPPILSMMPCTRSRNTRPAGKAGDIPRGRPACGSPGPRGVRISFCVAFQSRPFRREGGRDRFLGPPRVPPDRRRVSRDENPLILEKGV